MNSVTDEELMAFADGRLDEPRFSAIASLVEAEPDVAARLEALVVGGRAAGAVYGGLADLPVPAGLSQRVEAMAAGKLRTLPVRERPRWVSTALAACVAALVAVPVGYQLGRSGTDLPLVGAGAALDGRLAAALDRLPAGAEVAVGDGALLRTIATFTDGSGRLCREFEVDGSLATVAVACRAAEQWQVAIAIEAPLADDGYAPASSLAALDAFLAAIEAGPPLDAAAELEALGQR